MTTAITKATTRESVRDRLIITLAPEGIYVREKGRRTAYGPLAYGALRLACARINADAARRTTTKRRVRRGLLGGLR